MQSKQPTPSGKEMPLFDKIFTQLTYTNQEVIDILSNTYVGMTEGFIKANNQIRTDLMKELILNEGEKIIIKSFKGEACAVVQCINGLIVNRIDSDRLLN